MRFIAENTTNAREGLKKMSEMFRNLAVITGRFATDFEYHHTIHGKDFYIANLESERLSGVIDSIPIIAPENLVGNAAGWGRANAKVCGQFCSYKKAASLGGCRRLFAIAAQVIDRLDRQSITDGDENAVTLEGTVQGTPQSRLTPSGYEICDVMLAVIRASGKVDHLPCICWGRNARFASGLRAGDMAAVEGRIQSREYLKKFSETEVETRTAYEVSASKIWQVYKELEDGR